MPVGLNWQATWCVALAVLVAGCAKPIAAPPLPSALVVSLAVAADVNPDMHGRASPLVARLFELKTLDAFNGADFFALADHEKDTLGAELVAKEDLLLQPGEQRQFKRTLDPATRFVAVVASYRDIERSRWRASMPVALNQSTPVTLSARQRDIALTPMATATLP